MMGERTEYSLDEMVKYEGIYTFQCSECGEPFAKVDDWVEHVLDTHDDFDEGEYIGFDLVDLEKLN